MKYEETPIKNNINKKEINKKMKNNNLDNVNTTSIIWYLIKKHKFFLLATYAVVITAFYLMPFLTDVFNFF
jgi:hypothetical protein